MKNLILSISCVLIISALAFTGCSSTTEKNEKAEIETLKIKKGLAESEKELYTVKHDTTTYEQFKIEAEKAIAVQEKNIAELKAKIAKEKKDVKADYNKKLGELEKKNDELKKKLVDYKDEGKEKWKSFKAEFNHDMDEFGKAFEGLIEYDTK